MCSQSDCRMCHMETGVHIALVCMLMASHLDSIDNHAVRLNHVLNDKLSMQSLCLLGHWCLCSFAHQAILYKLHVTAHVKCCATSIALLKNGSSSEAIIGKRIHIVVRFTHCSHPFISYFSACARAFPVPLTLRSCPISH